MPRRHETALPFSRPGETCYACDSQRCVGFRDFRPEGGDLEYACARHRDPTIKVFKACMYCNRPTRRGSIIVDTNYAHRACHREARGS